jgi:hypothetical protein
VIDQAARLLSDDPSIGRGNRFATRGSGGVPAQQPGHSAAPRARRASLFANPYPEGYTACVIEIRQTDEFSRWFYRLKDRQARSRILLRIRRLSLGNPGWLEDSRRE